MSFNKLKARMARLKAAKTAKLKEQIEAEVRKDLAEEGLKPEPPVQQAQSHTLETHVEPTTNDGQVSKSDVDVSMFNTKQMLAVKLAKMGKSFNLIGAAGSGKTTATRGVITTLKESGQIGMLHEGTKKVLNARRPSVTVVSFTNQAVRNIKEALPVEYKAHCSTIHKLLEYEPEYSEREVLDEDGNWTGEYKKVMHYEPRYGVEPSTGHGKGQMLPHLDAIIMEEAGSIPTDLHDTFMSALPDPDNTIIIKLGDLNQLPPVFGDGILGYSLLMYPIVELTEVYRNVGLVTQFAHRVLEGKPISCQELADKWNLSDSSGSLKFNAFKSKTDPKQAAPTLGRHFKNLVIDGKFDYENDVLLVPFNKQVGTISLNKWLSAGVDKLLGRTVHEVMAGYQKSYWAVGDKVLHNKQYCKVIKIERNTKYSGKGVLQPSQHLTRWGRTTSEYEHSTVVEAAQEDLRSVEQMLDDAYDEQMEGGTLQASSIITLEATDESLMTAVGMPTYEVNTAGGINALLPVMAMSVHKAQGSEWRKVWGVLHHSHAVMFKRELIYTLVTRARQDLEIFYSGRVSTHKIGGSPFHMGIMNQEIEGRTIEQKLKYFKNKVMAEITSKSIKEGKGIPEDPTNVNIIDETTNLEQLQ